MWSQGAMKPFIDIHTHHPLGNNIGLCSYRFGVDYPIVQGERSSVGIHPWDAGRLDSRALALEALRGYDCAAIGEIGLDKACDVKFGEQCEVFEQQLIIASERTLPVIIHCVRAQQEVVDVLRRHPTLTVVFHGFIGSPQQMEQLVKHGYFISFGFGALGSPKTIDALRACPAERLFLESDTSNSDIRSLYEAVADLRGVNVEQLTADIYDNYKRIFQ